MSDRVIYVYYFYDPGTDVPLVQWYTLLIKELGSTR